MQAYQDPEYDVNADWAFALAFAADQRRYAFPVQDLQPCKNVDCANKSYAIFCCEACRVAGEGDDTEDYYRDDQSNVTLGHIATADTQHALDGENLAALVCGYGPQTAAPVAQPLPEAAASATVRLTIAGHTDVLFTVRDMDETRLLQRLETLLQRFPVQPPVVQPSAVQDPAHLCPVHRVTMEQQTNQRGSWWSHRAADGTWCKGKGVRHG